MQTLAMAVVGTSATENQIIEIIQSGRPVSASLVKSAPKGFVAKCRTARRTALMENSERIVGEIQQHGYRVAKLGAVKVLKSGDETLAVEFRKAAPVKKASAVDAEALIAAMDPAERDALIKKLLA